MTERLPRLRWKLRARFWTGFQSLRFSLAKERKIPEPVKTTRTIGLVPFVQVDPGIPLENVRTFDKLPASESDIGLRVMTATGLTLTKHISPMQPGVPEVDEDPYRVVDTAVSAKQRQQFRAPRRPQIYPIVGAHVELADLALSSPYAIFLERSADGELQWDFRKLGGFEHHPGLCNLGLRVVFAVSPANGSLEALRIESTEFGAVSKDDADWERSKRLAVCAATTHMSLTRHFNFVHLVAANHWDTVARNCLPRDHPLQRLLWPHLANGLYTDYGITKAQMLADGDFVAMFSFTHRGLMAYFDEMYEQYDVTVTDPEADWTRRGLDDLTIESPSQRNLTDLFGVMYRHAQRYIDAYWDTDQELRDDAAVALWLEQLDQTIPNGIEPLLGGKLPRHGVTRDSVARLSAAYMFEGNTIHSLVGTTLWDYQLWPDINPTRVYQSGQRVPVDVFQRVVNNNFGLQLRRAGLLDDYEYLALDDSKGPALFAEFRHDLQRLQDRYEQSDGDTWRMEPKNLEMSMNG